MQPVDDDDDNDWALMIKNRATRQMAYAGFAQGKSGLALTLVHYRLILRGI